MTAKRLQWSVVAILVLLAGSGGRAEGPKRVHFSGILDDHTLAMFGSWEMHGVWSMDVDQRKGTADFTAVMNMERADLFFVPPPAGNGGDPNNLAVRNAHTHHISVKDGTLSAITGGFRIAGGATVTGNGGVAPFGTNNNLQIDVTGGTVVTYSNIALTFSGDAIKHFGSAPIAGAVRRWTSGGDQDQDQDHD
jgi:hypothetical protein